MDAVKKETVEKLNRANEESKNSRIASIELLRSVAMLMVITLHYLDKGGILVPLTEKQGLWGYGAWLLEAFCIVAVNTYVLVSGYFLLEAGFKLRRLVYLLAQVLFYSILVPAVLVACGLIPLQDLTLYHFLNYVFPVQMNHYWFATAYILMYSFAPVLASGIKQMGKRQLQTIIVLLLLFFSVGKTILPFQLSIDAHGYDVVWFLCLFLIAAYIRLYGIPKITRSRQGFMVYAISCAAIFVWANVIAFLSSRLGKFGYFVSSTFDYNHILGLIGAVGLFLGFLYWKMPEGKFANIARKIAPYTFGVYLFHENREIRYLWPELLGADKYANGQWNPLHWIFCIAVIFAVGILIDWLRGMLFACIERLAQKVRTNKNKDK